MDGSGAEGERRPASESTGRGAGRRARVWVPLSVAGVVVVALAALATDRLARQDGTQLGASGASGSPSTSPAAPGVATITPPPSSGPVGNSAGPLLAVVDGSGALATMDGRGGSVVSYAVPGVVFGFPTWSPDGSRIAAVGQRSEDTSIYVFTVRHVGPGASDQPVVIYRSPDRPPFYLYWTPDGRAVAFLATEPDGLSLRIAPADGSAPLDGSGPGTIVRRGAPLYFDWEGADRLLLHVGSGSSAFVGEVGPDGASLAPALPGTGDFRSAAASPDGRYLAYVRAGTDPPGKVVVASRDGASQHEQPVYGPAAFAFAPAGDVLASIAADQPNTTGPTFPLGPLRLMDAPSGAIRTLLDGSVFAFFWAPDGRTIAALRLVSPGDHTADSGPALAALGDHMAATEAVLATLARAPMEAAATPPPVAEVHLAFVDVSTGVVRSERAVQLAGNFVNGLLPYFDQYALSHRLWAPDSASILLPLVDAKGAERLVAIPADGTESRSIADGVSGFWSP